jgi:serine protease Do
VVENAERVTVALDEKTKVQAKVLGTDPKTDLAVIQIQSKQESYPILSFGNSDQLQVGDWAIAIGSPFGLTQSVSFGIISAKGRGHMGILDIEDFIQTDAAINPGSSGGPLLNSRGEVIGVNTAIFSQGGGFMGIGFAVPSKIAKEVAEQIIANGRVKRGWIGVVAQDMTPELASYFRSSGKTGALISEVLPGSPAAGATIHRGDVILKYDGKEVTDATHLKAMVGKAVAGTKIPVEVSRRGANRNMTIKVSEQPAPPLPKTQMAGQVGKEKDLAKSHGAKLGLAVEDVPPEVSQFLKIPPGTTGAMVIGVKPGSPAFEAGFAPGDIILSANDEAVRSAADFTRIMKKFRGKDISVFYVQRGPEEKVYVPVKGTA